MINTISWIPVISNTSGGYDYYDFVNEPEIISCGSCTPSQDYVYYYDSQTSNDMSTIISSLSCAAFKAEVEIIGKISQLTGFDLKTNQLLFQIYPLVQLVINFTTNDTSNFKTFVRKLASVNLGPAITYDIIRDRKECRCKLDNSFWLFQSENPLASWRQDNPDCNCQVYIDNGYGGNCKFYGVNTYYNSSSPFINIREEMAILEDTVSVIANGEVNNIAKLVDIDLRLTRVCFDLSLKPKLIVAFAPTDSSKLDELVGKLALVNIAEGDVIYTLHQDSIEIVLNLPFYKLVK